MKLLFMGTPDFALSSLRALRNAGHEIAAVVTQPDKPKGRGHKMAHPPVYDYAVEHKIPVFQPPNLKRETFEEILKSIDPALIVVTAYGKILPEYVLCYPAYGCINVHASLLPKYRGAAPIQRCIMDGETQTGVTIMYMEKGLDTGDMILKAPVEILPDDTFETLHDKLAAAGEHALVTAVSQIEAGTAKREKQDHQMSSYAAMIDKETAKIDWSKNAFAICNLVRALYPAPKAQTSYQGKRLKIARAHMAKETSSKHPGTILVVNNEKILVACGKQSVLAVTELQMEGKRCMPVSEFLKGNLLLEGEVLGI